MINIVSDYGECRVLWKNNGKNIYGEDEQQNNTLQNGGLASA